MELVALDIMRLFLKRDDGEQFVIVVSDRSLKFKSVLNCKLYSDTICDHILYPFGHAARNLVVNYH